jgi:predicted ATPase with chaperone activity
MTFPQLVTPECFNRALEASRGAADLAASKDIQSSHITEAIQ